MTRAKDDITSKVLSAGREIGLTIRSSQALSPLHHPWNTYDWGMFK